MSNDVSKSLDELLAWDEQLEFADFAALQAEVEYKEALSLCVVLWNSDLLIEKRKAMNVAKERVAKLHEQRRKKS